MIMLEQVLSALLYGIITGGYYALMALGLSLIFGVMKIVNLSHGEFVVLAGYTSFWTYVFTGSLAISFFTAPLLTVILGLLVYKFLIKPIREEPELYSLLITFALGVFIANSLILAWTAEYRSIPSELNIISVDLLFAKVSAGNLISFIFSILLISLVYFFIEKTLLGKAIKASAENREVAMVLGINVYKIEMLSFGLGCGLAGLAGFWLAVLQYIVPTVTLSITVKAFILTALAGAGSIPGIIIAGFILGIGESFITTILSSSYSGLLGFILFVLILFLRPRGLMGK